MKDIFIILLFLGYISIGVILGFTINSEIINGEIFTILEISIGLILSTLYLFFRKSIYEKNIIYFENDLSWYQKEPNLFLVYFIGPLITVFMLTFIHKKYNDGTKKFVQYKIVKKGDQYIRYTKLSYLILENDSHKFKYNVKDLNKYKINQEVNATIKKGLFKFQYIDSIK